MIFPHHSFVLKLRNNYLVKISWIRREKAETGFNGDAKAKYLLDFPYKETEVDYWSNISDILITCGEHKKWISLSLKIVEDKIDLL